MNRKGLIYVLTTLILQNRFSVNGFISPSAFPIRKSNHLTGRTSINNCSVRLFGKRGNGKGKKEKRVSKSNLPEKICVVCERPFTWRKKWERCWDEVTCCSKSCNAKRRGGARDDGFVNY